MQCQSLSKVLVVPGALRKRIGKQRATLITTAQATGLFAEDRCSSTDISEICVYFCRFRLETAMMNIEQAFQSQV